MEEIYTLPIPDLEDLIEARVNSIEKRNKAIEASRRIEQETNRL